MIAACMRRRATCCFRGPDVTDVTDVTDVPGVTDVTTTCCFRGPRVSIWRSYTFSSFTAGGNPRTHRTKVLLSS